MAKAIGNRRINIVCGGKRYKFRRGEDIEIPDEKVKIFENSGYIKKVTKRNTPKQEDLPEEKHNIEEELLFKGKEENE